MNANSPNQLRADKTFRFSACLMPAHSYRESWRKSCRRDASSIPSPSSPLGARLARALALAQSAWNRGTVAETAIETVNDMPRSAGNKNKKRAQVEES